MMLRFCVADCTGLLESVTFAVKLDTLFGPAAVPEITPAPAFNVSPAGSVPLVMLHVNGPCPPLTPNVWLYALPIVPFGNVVVVTAGAVGKLIASVSALLAVCAGLLESATCRVKLAVPFGPDGVPAITPVVAFNVSPAGKAPVLILNA